MSWPVDSPRYVETKSRLSTHSFRPSPQNKISPIRYFLYATDGHLGSFLGHKLIWAELGLSNAFGRVKFNFSKDLFTLSRETNYRFHLVAKISTDYST